MIVTIIYIVYVLHLVYHQRRVRESKTSAQPKAKCLEDYNEVRHVSDNLCKENQSGALRRRASLFRLLSNEPLDWS